jgi:serine/threonine protein kinase
LKKGDLAELIRENKNTKTKFTDEKILSWMIEIIYGIHYLHNLKHDCTHDYKCVHRDIKPGNIFISNSGKIKLGDFSHSRLKDMYDSSTGKFKTNVGTNKYQSPEILNDKSYTFKTDCWYDLTIFKNFDFSSLI